jgi:hypothetical protein
MGTMIAVLAASTVWYNHPTAVFTNKILMTGAVLINSFFSIFQFLFSSLKCVLP